VTETTEFLTLYRFLPAICVDRHPMLMGSASIARKSAVMISKLHAVATMPAFMASSKIKPPRRNDEARAVGALGEMRIRLMKCVRLENSVGLRRKGDLANGAADFSHMPDIKS
jgi:hypothetical protein